VAGKQHAVAGGLEVEFERVGAAGNRRLVAGDDFFRV